MKIKQNDNAPNDFPSKFWPGNVGVSASIIAMLLSVSPGAMSQDTPGPLMIARQGSMEAGGRVINCATNDGGDPNSTRWPAGHVTVDNIYATYQYPYNQRYQYPILFNSGGGHTARFYDTTPDGREGWLTLFLREGFATYGVDRVNAGRSGTDICQINAVKLGKAPIETLPAINRYSAESSWVTFRWGPKYSVPYPNTQFPVEAANNYYPQTISTYRDPDETKKAVAAYSALLDKVGPVVLETWSSSGPMGFLTAAARPDMIKGMIVLEPSVKFGFDSLTPDDIKRLTKVPMIIVIGDHVDKAAVDVDTLRAFQKKVNDAGGDVTMDILPNAGIYGNGHTMALEKNNKQIMFRLIAWMEGHVYGRVPQASK